MGHKLLAVLTTPAHVAITRLNWLHTEVVCPHEDCLLGWKTGRLMRHNVE